MSRCFLLVVTMFCAQFSFAESLESREVNVALVINEIRDIDISRSHLNAVAEVLMSWDSNNSVAREPAPLNMPKTLSGADLEAFLTAQWTPEFYVTNAEAPRETIVRSASLYDDGRVEYFEKFRATLTVDAGIPSYPSESWTPSWNSALILTPQQSSAFCRSHFLSAMNPERSQWSRVTGVRWVTGRRL